MIRGATGCDLSVVVTTRNDDHGGDPLKRLQAFVNTFAAQCRRSGLDAEAIVVEWNPPAGRPKVHDLLRVPIECPFQIRFIEVPPELHSRLRYADVLPLFQMIAKNVGIRRARGRFVLATNIDIIFSTDLVDYLASRRLEPRRLYRVDRHDIQADYPVDQALEDQLLYCQTHQLRLHDRWGTHRVDACGRKQLAEGDIASPADISLGDGWHVREGDATGYFRWVKPEAHFVVDRIAPALAHGAFLEMEFRSNPYQPHSWVELEIFDGDRSIVRRQVSQQLRLRLALPDNVARHEMTLRMLDSSGGRESLPLLERRDALAYKVTSLKVGTAPTHVYDMAGWRRAYDNPGLQFEQTAAGIEIVTDSGKYSYCAHYDGLESPADGTYRFELEFSRVDGRFQLSALDDERNCWLPSTVEEIEFNGAALLSLSVDIPQGTKFSLVVSNYRPEGGISRFVLRRLVASAPFERLIRKAQPLAPVTRRWRSVVMGVLTAALRRVTRAASSAELQRARRYEDRIVDESERFRELEARVAAQNPLADLAPLVRLLRENRPPHIHENACGDFQLLAREDWHALRGYPELEMFSMNVDGLFEAIASCAGISEHLLDMPCCIYHLEHEKGSGWTPEGEALLQRRIAESGIGWLDLSAVRICTTYMHWLGRPMIFNGADWGFGDAVLPETTLERVPVGS